MQEKELIINGIKVKANVPDRWCEEHMMLENAALKKKIKSLEKDLEFQCNQTKKFEKELQYFMKDKANVRFEIKLKKYRDEIVRLKKELGKRK